MYVIDLSAMFSVMFSVMFSLLCSHLAENAMEMHVVVLTVTPVDTRTIAPALPSPAPVSPFVRHVHVPNVHRHVTRFTTVGGEAF